jgi:hypothetical protein
MFSIKEVTFGTGDEKLRAIGVTSTISLGLKEKIIHQYREKY